MLSRESEILILLARLEPSEELKTSVIEKISQDLDWAKIFELAMFHRVVPLAWKTIQKLKHIGNLNSSIITAMRYIYLGVRKRNETFFKEINSINEAFVQENIQTLLLKGVVLADRIYKDIGLRQFSDVDYLVKKKDLSKVQTILRKLGYVQGNYDLDDQKIILATKKEKLLRRMNTHEIVEHCKLSNDDFCPVFYVDINFDFMWKGHDKQRRRYQIDIQKIFENAILNKFASSKVYSLDTEYQLIHLCTHLFCEAMYFVHTPQWAKNLSDLKLFRFCDIYELIQQCHVDWERLKSLIENNFEEPVYYALSLLTKLYENSVPLKFLNSLRVDETIVDRFYDKQGDEVYWELDFFDRMFDPHKKVAELDRKGIL